MISWSESRWLGLARSCSPRLLLPLMSQRSLPLLLGADKGRKRWNVGQAAGLPRLWQASGLPHGSQRLGHAKQECRIHRFEAQGFQLLVAAGEIDEQSAD